MDNANRTSTPEAVSAEDLAIAQEVDKAFRLYESTIQVARLAASLEKKNKPWPREYSWDNPSGFVFRD